MIQVKKMGEEPGLRNSKWYSQEELSKQRRKTGGKGRKKIRRVNTAA